MFLRDNLNMMPEWIPYLVAHSPGHFLVISGNLKLVIGTNILWSILTLTFETDILVLWPPIRKWDVYVAF